MNDLFGKLDKIMFMVQEHLHAENKKDKMLLFFFIFKTRLSFAKQKKLRLYNLR